MQPSLGNLTRGNLRITISGLYQDLCGATKTSRCDVSECAKTEAMPNHAKRSGQKAGPIMPIVGGPGVTFAAPDCNRIERQSLPSPCHGPIFPHRLA
jgi:hypothetical protein